MDASLLLSCSTVATQLVVIAGNMRQRARPTASAAGRLVYYAFNLPAHRRALFISNGDEEIGKATARR
jgi:hypothetical protein